MSAKTRPDIANSPNDALVEETGNALLEVRGSPDGAKRHAAALETSGTFVHLTRPLGKGEETGDGNRKRRLQVNDSESEVDESPGERARDAEWDGVMKLLAESKHPSITKGITPRHVASASQLYHGSSAGAAVEGPATAKRVWSSLKALANEGGATRHEAGRDTEERIAVKASAYGECPTGAVAPGVDFAVFDAVDVELD